MAQRVLIPLPGVGTLALDEETYRSALEEGAKFNPPPEPRQTPASAYLIPNSWLMFCRCP
jgi:hypothetical protein